MRIEKPRQTIDIQTFSTWLVVHEGKHLYSAGVSKNSF